MTGRTVLGCATSAWLSRSHDSPGLCRKARGIRAEVKISGIFLGQSQGISLGGFARAASVCLWSSRHSLPGRYPFPPRTVLWRLILTVNPLFLQRLWPLSSPNPGDTLGKICTVAYWHPFFLQSLCILIFSNYYFSISLKGLKKNKKCIKKELIVCSMPLPHPIFWVDPH